MKGLTSINQNLWFLLFGGFAFSIKIKNVCSFQVIAQRCNLQAIDYGRMFSAKLTKINQIKLRPILRLSYLGNIKQCRRCSCLLTFRYLLFCKYHNLELSVENHRYWSVQTRHSSLCFPQWMVVWKNRKFPISALM